jgi:hypothetical protein
MDLRSITILYASDPDIFGKKACCEAMATAGRPKPLRSSITSTSISQKYLRIIEHFSCECVELFG